MYCRKSKNKRHCRCRDCVSFKCNYRR